MKILITWYSTSRGGAELSCVDLCNYLAKSKEISSIVFLLVTSFPGGMIKDKLNFSDKVCFYHVRSCLFLWNLISFFTVAYLCLKKRPDIVQTNFRAVFGESLAGKLMGKKVISCLRVILIDRNNLISFLPVDMIIGISKAVIKRIRDLGWKKGTVVIYNGIDTEKLPRAKYPDANVLREKIYYMSRWVRWKRPLMFVEAAIRVHADIKPASFTLFGEGPKEADIVGRVKEARCGDFVKMGGWVDHFDDILNPFGILVLTSFEEPFGRVVVEAVVRGKVVVVPRSGAMPELFPDYDLLFERDSLEDLVQKIKMAYENFDYYRNQIMEKQKMFLEVYNMDRVWQEYVNVYKNVLLNTKKIIRTYPKTANSHLLQINSSGGLAKP